MMLKQTMNRRGRLGVALAWMVALAVVVMDASAEPLRVRLGAAARGEMELLGVEAGSVRLRPVGSSTGEIVMPFADLRELLFVLPEPYQRAQQLAFNGRPGEAAIMLKPVVAPLVPYLSVPDTNAVAAVNFYFDLLLGQQMWDEALALAKQLPLDSPKTGFLPKVVSLARALRATGRPIDATTLVGRIPFTETTSGWFPLMADFADELRRNGSYVEARTIYERLRPFDTGEAQVRRTLLIAYADYQTGGRSSAAAFLEMVPEPAADSDELPLYLLLQSRLALDAGDATRALDQIGRAMVLAGGASEWRAELQAVAAMAYRAAGQFEIAETIEADMRQIFPDSRWTPAAAQPVS